MKTHTPFSRRTALKTLTVMPLLASMTGSAPATSLPSFSTPVTDRVPLKLSLNAYSFNAPLSDGSMTIRDMLEFCSSKGFSGVDITAYYFPGYPAVPPDHVLYQAKLDAFRLGLGISGTGVRNDFTHPDDAKRRESIALVKNWIEAAEKLGAPVVRIFSGTQNPGGYTRDQILAWMVKDIRECVAYGRAHGVVVALQNHDDFIKTGEQTIQLMEAVSDPWFGLILDTGSFRSGDPYAQIAATAPYAVNWQIKEKIYVDGKETETDLDRLMAIIRKSGYRGYLPIETLGAGDPKTKISAMLEKVNRALGRM